MIYAVVGLIGFFLGTYIAIWAIHRSVVVPLRKDLLKALNGWESALEELQRVVNEAADKPLKALSRSTMNDADPKCVCGDESSLHIDGDGRCFHGDCGCKEFEEEYDE